MDNVPCTIFFRTAQYEIGFNCWSITVNFNPSELTGNYWENKFVEKKTLYVVSKTARKWNTKLQIPGQPCSNSWTRAQCEDTYDDFKWKYSEPCCIGRKEYLLSVCMSILDHTKMKILDNWKYNQYEMKQSTTVYKLFKQNDSWKNTETDFAV